MSDLLKLKQNLSIVKLGSCIHKGNNADKKERVNHSLATFNKPTNTTTILPLTSTDQAHVATPTSYQQLNYKTATQAGNFYFDKLSTVINKH